MDPNSPLFQFFLNIAVGTVAGGVTNVVAVKMLFHPREPRFGLQGAIPKNKARLARAIGRMVGQRLLAPEDLARELNGSGLRETFDAKVGEAIEGLLRTERGALRDLLPAPVLLEVERLADQAATLGAERAAAYAATPAFEARVLEFVQRTREELANAPVGDVLTPRRRESIAARALQWAGEVAESSELERAVRDYLDRHARELLASDRPLVSHLPPGLVGAVDGAIDAFLPVAMQRVGHFLADPEARARIQGALNALFSRVVEDLRFHERVLARLVVTERTFERALASLSTDGVEQLAALLEDPEVRERLAHSIRDAVVTWLGRPARELFGEAGDARAAAITATAGDYLLKVLRAEGTRTFLVDKLQAVMERAEGRTWGELLAHVDDETLARFLVDVARTPRAREGAEQAIRALLRTLLDRPLGVPGRWAPHDASERVARAVAPPLWDWLQSRVPDALSHVDLEEIVERKVMGFSTDRVEELILEITDKELKLIVNLGFVLGAFIGVLTWAVSLLAERVG